MSIAASAKYHDITKKFITRIFLANLIARNIVEHKTFLRCIAKPPPPKTCNGVVRTNLKIYKRYEGGEKKNREFDVVHHKKLWIELRSKKSSNWIAETGDLFGDDTVFIESSMTVGQEHHWGEVWNPFMLKSKPSSFWTWKLFKLPYQGRTSLYLTEKANFTFSMFKNVKWN